VTDENGKYTVKELISLVVLPELRQMGEQLQRIDQRVRGLEDVMLSSSARAEQRHAAWRVSERVFQVFVGLAVIGSMAAAITALVAR
jgi:hypothetical protein